MHHGALGWAARDPVKVPRGPGRAEGEDTTELRRAEQEKEKRQREAAAEELDILGKGRDRKDMLHKWAQRLRGKLSKWQSLLIDNGETQPGLEGHIKGCRTEDVRQAVSKPRFHMKDRQEAVENRCAGASMAYKTRKWERRGEVEYMMWRQSMDSC